MIQCLLETKVLFLFFFYSTCFKTSCQLHMLLGISILIDKLSLILQGSVLWLLNYFWCLLLALSGMQSYGLRRHLWKVYMFLFLSLLTFTWVQDSLIFRWCHKLSDLIDLILIVFIVFWSLHDYWHVFRIPLSHPSTKDPMSLWIPFLWYCWSLLFFKNCRIISLSSGICSYLPGSSWSIAFTGHRWMMSGFLR